METSFNKWIQFFHQMGRLLWSICFGKELDEIHLLKLVSISSIRSYWLENFKFLDSLLFRSGGALLRRLHLAPAAGLALHLLVELEVELFAGIERGTGRGTRTRLPSPSPRGLGKEALVQSVFKI